MQQLSDAGFQKHNSSPGGNNCLIDSLLTTLIQSGYLPPPIDRKRKRDELRTWLCSLPHLHPRTSHGRQDPKAYLEHGRHADAIVRDLMVHPQALPFPQGGFRCIVQARYDNVRSPPDEVYIGMQAFGCILPKSQERPPIGLHLFNWTGNECTGYHDDALHKPL